MLMIFAYDIHGILTSHRVPNGQTVNGKYYREYIQKCLRPSIRKKRPELLEARPIILHDNATPHVSAGVTSLLSSYGWEKLAHPAYSPDISPSDFDLFPVLKKQLRGVRYNDLDELEAAVVNQVRVYERGCLATGVAMLPHRWNSLIEHKGHYFEGF